MLTLEHKLTLSKEVIEAPNLTSSFSDKDLTAIGGWVYDGFQADKQSRAAWERRTSAAMDLAMQLTKAKNFPWPNCANIAFPLVTIAALQFHARAYPAVVSGTDIVKCRVIGKDSEGKKKERAERVSCHMSYQVLEQDKAWEEQHDRLLINLPIIGCAFKKTYYDARLGHNVSELVLARDLVLNYYAKSVEGCSRKTHLISLPRNHLHEQIARKVFRDVKEEGWYRGLPPLQEIDPQQAEKNRRAGSQPPRADETTPFVGLEQHCSLDLDGDGYAEPYIITIEQSSRCVLRIVSRVGREEDIEREGDQIVSIRAEEFFTKYPFIPAPDGSIYDIGFGLFLGPLNEQVNTICNQLTDAGTMSAAAGGFLGRGAKIRGGVYAFSPFQWNRVDSTGEDLHKSIFPLPVREPSAVLFNLLTMLVNYSNRISGATDLMVGESIGQNTPAETGRTMAEQGMKIYSSIFKRVWRGMKEEFKKLYILNGLYMPLSGGGYGDGRSALREDYLGNPDDICPAADPNVTSDAMAYNQITAVKQSAASTPGYDSDEVERLFLRSLKVDSIDKIFPGSKKLPPGVHPKVQIAQLQVEVKKLELKADAHKFVAQLQVDMQLNNAEILKLQADAMKALADIQGDQRDREVNALNAAIGALKVRNEIIARKVELLLQGMEHDRETADGEGMGGVADQSMQPGAAPMGAGAQVAAAGAVG